MSKRNESLVTELMKEFNTVQSKLASNFKSKIERELKDNCKATLEKIRNFLKVVKSLPGTKINESQVKTAISQRKGMTINDKVNATIVERNREVRKFENKALGGTFHEMIYDLEDDSQFNSSRTDIDYIESKMKSIKRIISDMLLKRLKTVSGSKVGLMFLITIQTLMGEKLDESTKEQVHNFNSGVFKIYSANRVSSIVDTLVSKYFEDITNPSNGSSWSFKHFMNVRLKSNKYELSTGKSFILLPKDVQDKGACVNPTNEDARCFEWCIAVSKSYHKMLKKKKFPAHTYHYSLNDIKRPDDVTYPVSEDMYGRYEDLNNMQINVFELTDNDESKDLLERVSLIYKGPMHRKEVINLLLFHRDGKSHYVWIKNLSRFFASQTLRKSKHLCPHCFKKNNSEEMLMEHIEECCNLCSDNCQIDCKYELPKEGSTLAYVNKGRSFKHPFHVIADFESTLKPCDIKNESEDETTHKYQEHVPNSFGLKYCSIYEEYDDDIEVYNHSDPEKVKEQFVLRLEKLAVKSYQIMKKNKFNITNIDYKRHKNSVICPECKLEYTDKNYKVKHHDHITGEYIDTICNKCNLNLTLKPFLPVYLHNLKGYDSHLFVSSLNRYGQKNADLSCIPNNEEKYISFSKTIAVDVEKYYCKITEEFKEKEVLFEIRFLDTIAFMNTGLDSLVKDLKKGCSTYEDYKKVFKNTSKHFTNESDFMLMIQKGVYPYDYVSEYSKMYEKSLPLKEEFYSKLNDCDIDDKAYATANEVWNHFSCEQFLDYHNLYLKSDVLLLADVWDNFRTVCYNAYNLDCVYYYTAPGLSFDSMLKMTGIELDLLSELEMYEFFNSGIRGGLSNIVKRYAKANNKEMADYDEKKEESHILYTDINNLYGYAMSEYMPYKNFKWNNGLWSKDSIMKLDDKGADGYVFEVDLHIPRELHDHCCSIACCICYITISD